VVGDEFGASQMLVVTPLTRKSRVAYMKALSDGKVLQYQGPPGSGKTETFKDTCRMLGQEAVVYSLSQEFTVDCFTPVIKEKGGRGRANFCIVLDEANRCSPEVLNKVLDDLQKAGAFVCVTMNPGLEGGAEVKIEGVVSLDFTVPGFVKIVEVMLACEGFTEATELAPKFMAATTACGEKCSKHASYDFGLRALRGIVRAAALVGKAANWANESQSVALALVQALHVRALGSDKDVVKAELEVVFGSVEVPEAFLGKDAAAVAAMVAEVAKFRHGVCVTGDVDVNECVDAINKAMCSESILVSLEDDAAARAVGGGIDAVWARLSDPASGFVKAFREAMVKEGPVNLVIQGALDQEAMESMNTLLDDNKVFITSSGERLNAIATMRFIFFNDCSKWSPATVSRLGCVGLSA